MRLAGLLHRAARLCRGCVPWSSRGAAAPQLCGGRVPIIQALKAAGGSGSRRSAVCRFSARSLCAGAVRRGRVVRFFKGNGLSDRQNPQHFPAGSQSSCACGA